MPSSKTKKSQKINSCGGKKDNSKKVTDSYHNMDSEKKDLGQIISIINIHGIPYIMKFFLLLVIEILILILPHDIMSHSINVATLIATLTIDTWISENQSKFVLYNKFKGVHFVYWIILFFALSICIIIAIYCAIAQLNNENISFEGFTISLIVIAIVGLLSPIFELIYAVLDHAKD